MIITYDRYVLLFRVPVVNIKYDSNLHGFSRQKFPTKNRKINSVLGQRTWSSKRSMFFRTCLKISKIKNYNFWSLSRIVRVDYRRRFLLGGGERTKFPLYQSGDAVCRKTDLYRHNNLLRLITYYIPSEIEKYWRKKKIKKSSISLRKYANGAFNKAPKLHTPRLLSHHKI